LFSNPIKQKPLAQGTVIQSANNFPPKSGGGQEDLVIGLTAYTEYPKTKSIYLTKLKKLPAKAILRIFYKLTEANFSAISLLF